MLARMAFNSRRSCRTASDVSPYTRVSSTHETASVVLVADLPDVSSSMRTVLNNSRDDDLFSLNFINAT